MPEALIERLEAARRFNQGFATTEFVAAALFDMELHLVADPGAIDVAEFERRTLAAIGMPSAIATRHSAPHFQHVFSGDGYSAGYYSYLWSEALDADAFEAFEQAGDDFDPALAERLKRFVYAAGNRARAGRGLPRLSRPRSVARRAAAQTRVGRLRGGHMTGLDPIGAKITS